MQTLRQSILGPVTGRVCQPPNLNVVGFFAKWVGVGPAALENLQPQTHALLFFLFPSTDGVNKKHILSGVSSHNVNSWWHFLYRLHQDSNLDWWIQSPECWPLHHGTYQLHAGCTYPHKNIWLALSIPFGRTSVHTHELHTNKFQHRNVTGAVA